MDQKKGGQTRDPKRTAYRVSPALPREVNRYRNVTFQSSSYLPEAYTQTQESIQNDHRIVIVDEADENSAAK